MSRLSPGSPTTRRHVLFACLAAALALGQVGCSKDETNPVVPGEPTEQLGTPMSLPGEVDGAVLWSVATNELVTTGSAARVFADLVAISRNTGARRILDTLTSIPIELGPGDSIVYYIALESMVYARWMSLLSSPAPQTLDSCQFLCLPIPLPAPDGNQVAVSGDPLVIYQRDPPQRLPMMIAGTPIVFSPTSDRLLFSTDFFDPLGTAQILTIDGGAVEPANLGVSGPVAGHRVRWGDQGLEVLYLDSDRKRLFHRLVETATTTLIWTSPDTLEGTRMAWSRSGRRAAIWSSRPIPDQAPYARRFELHAIDVLARSAHRIAYAQRGNAVPARLLPPALAASRPPFGGHADIFDLTELGGIAISPNEAEVGYIYSYRLYRSSFTTPVALVANGAR